MSLTPHQKDDLDRHITGNYGEDQFTDYDNTECRVCGAPFDESGTAEEEHAASERLCMDCYDPDPDQEYDRRRDEEMVR